MVSPSSRSCLLAHSLALVVLALATVPVADAAVAVDPKYGNQGTVVGPNILPYSNFSVGDAAVTSTGGMVVINSEYPQDWPEVVFFTGKGKVDERFGKYGRLAFPGWLKRRFDSQIFQDVEIQRDGKILLAGPADVSIPADDRRCRCKAVIEGWGVIRLNRTGGLDKSFGDRGFARLRRVALPRLYSLNYTPATWIWGMQQDPRGGIILYGNSTWARSTNYYRETNDEVIVRLNRDGLQDRSFGHGGRILQKPSDRGANMIVRGDSTIVTVRQRDQGLTPRKAQRYAYGVIRRYDLRGRPLKGRGASGPYRRVLLRTGGGEASPIVFGSGAVTFVMDPGEWTDRLTMVRVLPSGRIDRRFGRRGTFTYRLPARDRKRVRFGWDIDVVGVTGSYRVLLSEFDDGQPDHLITINGRGRLIAEPGGAVLTHLPEPPSGTYVSPESMLSYGRSKILMLEQFSSSTESQRLAVTRYRTYRGPTG